MALLVLLIPADQDDLSLGAKNVEALARLGVTSVSLARDEQTAAVILEGWAFDPASHGAALAALGASRKTARALQPVVEMAVSTAATQPGGSSS
jgi:hypothetical protein